MGHRLPQITPKKPQDVQSPILEENPKAFGLLLLNFFFCFFLILKICFYLRPITIRKGYYAKAVHRGSILQGLRDLHRVLSG